MTDDLKILYEKNLHTIVVYVKDSMEREVLSPVPWKKMMIWSFREKKKISNGANNPASSGQPLVSYTVYTTVHRPKKFFTMVLLHY